MTLAGWIALILVGLAGVVVLVEMVLHAKSLPPDGCRCGHLRLTHSIGGDCLGYACYCQNFNPW